MGFELQVATTAEQIEQVRDLFLEYQRAIDVDLCFQGFEREVAKLPGEYAGPRGRLYLATSDAAPAGCVALRPLSTADCELKRLYVRPAFRASGLGVLLAGRAIDAARQCDYRRVLLDTLPSMTAAQHLYEKLGFRDTEPCVHNPEPGMRFMALDLVPEGESTRNEPA
jgi:putative acetyltransferase